MAFKSTLLLYQATTVPLVAVWIAAVVLFQPDVEPIEHDRVRIVDNITHQLIVHIEAIIKIFA